MHIAETNVRFLLTTAMFAVIQVFLSLSADATQCFQKQYVLDEAFTNSSEFVNVTDVAINHIEQHVLVLQRSVPPISVWSTNGTLLFAWDIRKSSGILIH